MVVDRKIQPVSSDVIEGSSPDMILKVKYPEYVTYVPVEIKCHDSEIKNNKDQRRIISLATKQLQTVARLMNCGIKLGLLLVLSVTEVKFYLDATLINL